MKCPYCGDDQSRVIDSRPVEEEDAIRRRRECARCHRRFTTHERVVAAPYKVIKRDGSRVPFDRDKIRFGLEKACYKRPVSEETIQGVIQQIERQIYENYDREVPSVDIGEMVCEALQEIDHVAYVRFASVYRRFEDVTDFMDEVRQLKKKAPRRRPGDSDAPTGR
ncbi:MAG: transcriptional repressor NrdR [Planctomycetota bacterium]|nr:MAG: transcriptional repressor NrdR [Planctomycetota bacterium]